MYPHSHPAAPRRSRGFTLIELLVVIAIIGVLVVLLSPMLQVVQNRSRKVQAINDMRNIKTSILSYYSDYRKYPINDVQASAAAGDSGQDTMYGDPGGLYPNVNLFNILRSIGTDANTPNPLNPNKVVYWDGQMVKDRKNPRSGITYDDQTINGNKIGAGSFVDPWGNPYIVWIDATNDGDLSAAAHWYYYDSAPDKGTVVPGLPPMGLEFGSLGPDGKWGTNGNYLLKGSDDVVTW